jgi:hypothetical protein
MNRVGDYGRFAGWFCGLGYMALSPWTAQEDGLLLSPGLHLAGMTASAFVLAAIALWPLRRLWRRCAAGKTVAIPQVIMRLRIGQKRAPPPHRYVRPRTHFGLRNGPH